MVTSTRQLYLESSLSYPSGVWFKLSVVYKSSPMQLTAYFDASEAGSQTSPGVVTMRKNNTLQKSTSTQPKVHLFKGTRGGKSHIPEVVAVILNYCGTC